MIWNTRVSDFVCKVWSGRERAMPARGARARRHGLCGEPAYAGLRRTRRGRATRTGTRVERVKSTPHPSVLVGGVRQRRGAP